MAKIVLDRIPKWPDDNCPFYYIICHGDCQCLSVYSDSQCFEFDKCPYCTTITNVNPCI